LRFPEITLSQAEAGFFRADFPDDPEKGAFLRIEKQGPRCSVQVDHFSQVPFYYAIHDGKLYGATRLHALLSELPSSFERKLDEVAAIQFIRTNSMMGERTLLQGICRVPYGCRIVHEEGEDAARVVRYWELPGEVDNSLQLEPALDRARQATDAAFADYARGFTSVGVHLSGGLDSRVVLGAIRNSGADFTAFTYGVEQNLDCVIARELANAFGFRHEYRSWDGVSTFRDNFPLQQKLTDGMQALIHGHGLEMHEEESRSVQRLFIGHFLDMFLYSHMYRPGLDSLSGAERQREMYALFDGGPCSIMKGDDKESAMFTPEWQGVFRESMVPEISRFDFMIPEKQYDALYLVHHGLRRLMPQVQSAAAFLDSSAPGLERDLFAFNWSVPGHLRKRREFQIALLRRKYPDLVDRIRIVMDNKRLRYIGNSPVAAAMSALEGRLRASRFFPLKPYYAYYGSDFRPLFEKNILPWMREIMKTSPLLDAGLLRPDFIRSLFDASSLRPDLPHSLYSAIFTLDGFIRSYIQKAPAGR
jgi:hypothetical protein